METPPFRPQDSWDMQYEDNRTNYQKEIDKWRGEAEGRHYRFVQFVTGLSAGMLGLLVPQRSAGDLPNPIAAQLELWALGFLTVSLVLGVTALYGEKNVRNHRADVLEALRRKHRGDEILASGEAVMLGQPRPPAIHRADFYAQIPCGILALLLLLASKAALFC